ncbi:hypothetical protein AJ80_09050 [Polytolypa hystricis UAMH7299]|uniref:Initiator tRNA phosphoribosyl transferase n=1 Tax=Polytolypa hystricis (strain UAMH7299) TaxID=1447883 RepID=A0A2B7WWT5_POLH7|nr:hypothetical protein AJ80_09050 [Polytolypa hystricis UAMH7299]
MAGGQKPLPVSISELHFPSSEQPNLSHILSSLRRSTLSIPNRLRSIESDSHFAQHVAEVYGLPLVANERCGSWYIPPELKAGSAYFKSTDGHAGQWDFSLRRLNLQVLDIIREHGGCVIVDSTRRGKSMPDALSKTVPIWCAVMNRALFPERQSFHNAQFPPDFLGRSEESQIESRIDRFVASLKTLKLNLDESKTRLGKPIRLTWASREYMWPEYSGADGRDDFHVVVLCSASKRVHGAEMSEGGYIQGAGDDSEAWAQGLTPTVFWENKPALFGTNEEELPQLIKELLELHRQKQSIEKATLIMPTRNLYLGRTGATSADTVEQFDLLVSCNGEAKLATMTDGKAKSLNLGCPAGKLGSRHLRKVLPKVEQFVSAHMKSTSCQPLLVTCETGKDLSVGTILTILCLFYDDAGNFTGSRRAEPVDKEYIRQRFAWIVSSKQDANPSRSTLQSVNSYLMERPG